MSDILKSQFFVIRDGGDMVPLIAMDELPKKISVAGVPRTLGRKDVAGMVCVGNHAARQYTHTVECEDDCKVPVTKSDNTALVAEKAVTGNLSTVMPQPGKKTYCSYWVRRGECDYAQQGCVYKHEMPHDLAILNAIGLSDIPFWFREKFGVGSLKAISGSDAALGGSKMNSNTRGQAAWRKFAKQEAAKPTPGIYDKRFETPSKFRPGKPGKLSSKNTVLRPFADGTLGGPGPVVPPEPKDNRTTANAQVAAPAVKDRVKTEADIHNLMDAITALDITGYGAIKPSNSVQPSPSPKHSPSEKVSEKVGTFTVSTGESVTSISDLSSGNEAGASESSSYVHTTPVKDLKTVKSSDSFRTALSDGKNKESQPAPTAPLSPFPRMDPNSFSRSLSQIPAGPAIPTGPKAHVNKNAPRRRREASAAPSIASTVSDIEGDIYRQEALRKAREDHDYIASIAQSKQHARQIRDSDNIALNQALSRLHHQVATLRPVEHREVFKPGNGYRSSSQQGSRQGRGRKPQQPPAGRKASRQ